MSEEDLFHAFVEAIQQMVESVGPQLSPDEDWPPAIAAGDSTVTVDGQHRPLTVTTLPGNAFRDDDTKDVVAHYLIPLYVRRSGADMAAFLSSAWVTLGRDAFPNPEVERAYDRFFKKHKRAPISYAELEEVGIARPVNDPNRREAVTIMARSKDGRTMLSTGMIVRHDNAPPTIENWEGIEGEGDTNTAGRFADGLERAFSDEAIIDDPGLAHIVDGLLGKIADAAPSHPWKDA